MTPEQMLDRVEVWDMTKGARWKDGVMLERYEKDPFSSSFGKSVVDAADCYALLYEIDELRMELREIDKFGHENPGCGWSCAEKAKAALNRSELGASEGQVKP